MYWDPILSSMNMLRADKILSGLSALSNNNLEGGNIFEGLG